MHWAITCDRMSTDPEKTTVADLGVWRGGMTPSKSISRNWVNGKVLWVTPKDMTSPVILTSQEKITASALTSYGLTLFKSECIAVVFRSGILKHSFPVAFGLVPFTVNQDLKVLEPKQGVVPRFAYQTLSALGPRVLRFAVKAGTTVESVDLKTFLSLPIFLPEPGEQRRIAEILDTVDATIQQTDALVAKLRQIKIGLIQDLLKYGLNTHGNLRDPAKEPNQFENSLFGSKPKEWEVVTLAERKSPNRPYIKTGPFGSSLKGEHWVTEGVPVITIGALGEGEIIKSELLFISRSKARSLEPYAVNAGDLVFSRVADIGRSIVIGEAEDGWIMSSNLMRISLDIRKVNPYFIYLSIVYNERVREQIRRLVNAGGRDIVNTPILDSIKFALPQLGEQNEIVKAVLAHNTRIRAEENTRDKLKAVKQGLTQDLLT